MAKKTTCPISRAQFRGKAQPLSLTINGKPMTVPVKEFSTGSLGWYLNQKIDVDIDGVPVSVQLGLNFTIVGSKDLPLDAGSPGQAKESAPEAGAPANPPADDASS